MNKRVLILLITLILAAQGTSFVLSKKFPFSDKVLKEYGTTIHGVSLLKSENGYYVGSYSKMNGDHKRRFMFTLLMQGQYKSFSWKIFNDRSLDQALTRFFSDSSPEKFWTPIMEKFHDFSEKVIGPDHNSMFLKIYLIPENSRIEIYKKRYHPTKIPMQFYFSLPTKNLTDQDFIFIKMIAHEYAHIRLKLSKFSIINTISEEVVVRTFEWGFISLFSETVVIQIEDENGNLSPIELPVCFPTTIPEDKDKDKYYFISQEIAFKNIVNFTGSNRIETKEEKNSLFSLSRALFRYSHDFSKSFFPVNLVEIVDFPDDWTDQPENH